jgi:hypothetical protein
MADPEKGDFNQISEPGNEPDLTALGANDASAIPRGTIDPVYEAKARVLNHAVCSIFRFINTPDDYRFKKLVWDGINGSYS